MMATAYGLVLMALSLEQASYVGTARNASLIFGVILGALVLGERAPAVRLIAASAIVAGIALLGLG
jgi:drug/metabolite transporter (DMT)-like permease